MFALLPIRSITRLTLLLALFGTLLPLAASTNLALESQRQTFVAAEEAAKKGQYSRYQQLRDSLRDYPLHPYLVYHELIGDLSPRNDQRIAEFLSTQAETPLADQLRKRLLPKIAADQDWRRYLRFHVPSDDDTLQCHHLRALLETGRRDEMLDQVPALWLHGKSRSSACDPVFKAWRQAGRLTPELVWGRIELALEEKKGVALATYLGRYLPTAQQPLLALWIRVHDSPSLITSSAVKGAASPLRERIMIHGLWQMMLDKDARDALTAWRELADRFSFDEAQRARIEERIAFKLLWADDPLALKWVREMPIERRSEKLIDTSVREAVGLHAWQDLARIVGETPTAERSEYQRYWLGRSLEKLGRSDEAVGILRELAKERTYHGFLAADRVNQPYNLANVPLKPNQALLQRVEDRPAVRRARELFALNRMVDARREWYRLLDQLTTEEKQAFSKIMQSWGWHSRAIFTLAKTDYWDDLDLRFPLEHRNEILSMAKERELDQSWVYAVVRQESAFIPDARSPSGALGLMQLMPATAREVAHKLKLKSPRKDELLQPRLNVTLGTSYLRQMLDRLFQHPVLATAAYNAGPHRVNKWLPDTSVPAEEWVATIPFDETRGYVERIMSYTVIYDQRLGLPPRHLSDTMLHPIGRDQEVTALTPAKSDAG